MLLSDVFFYPTTNTLDKTLPGTKTLNAQEIHNKAGVFGKNHVPGFLVGITIGLAIGRSSSALLFDV